MEPVRQNWRFVMAFLDHGMDFDPMDERFLRSSEGHEVPQLTPARCLGGMYPAEHDLAELLVGSADAGQSLCRTPA